MALTCWPPRSPDLTPCDFFLWGCIKDRVFVPPLPVGFFYLLYYTTILLQTISTLIFYPIVHDVWSNIPVIILTLVVPISVYGAYKNLVISSIGLSHFNRLGSSFSSRTGMSSLGCVINFSRSEISPTRSNNCVFLLRNGFTLHVSGENLTHHQEYICCIWPQVSRLT